MTTRRDLFKKLFAGAAAALGARQLAKAEKPLRNGLTAFPNTSSKTGTRSLATGIRGRRSLHLTCAHDLEMGPLYVFTYGAQTGNWRMVSKTQSSEPLFHYEFVEAPGMLL